MTNEEAFEKFFPKPMVFENKEHELTALSQWYDLQRGWKTAIAYMQEQSEPVAWMDDFDECDVIPNAVKAKLGMSQYSIPLYTTPQRQQPLNRLSGEQINKCFENVMFDEEVKPTRERIANAIMDAMQELNK